MKFDHIQDVRFKTIVEGVYDAVCNTNNWEFFKTADLKNFTFNYTTELTKVMWEIEIMDIECTTDELEVAFSHIKKIAIHGWDNYMLNI